MKKITEKEYEFTIEFELGVSGQSMDRVNITGLKKELKRLIQIHMEKQDNIVEWDFWNDEQKTDYEKID